MDCNKKFRLEYPYGIVLDVKNGEYALFNRYYKRLGEERDKKRVYRSITDLLDFSLCDKVNSELKKELLKVVEENKSNMYAQMEEGLFRVFFYNDGTVPYAPPGLEDKEKRIEEFKAYTHILDIVSHLLNIQWSFNLDLLN